MLRMKNWVKLKEMFIPKLGLASMFVAFSMTPLGVNANDSVKYGSLTIENDSPMSLAKESAVGFAETTKGKDRITYKATKKDRGTTLNIPVQDVARLCGDGDGCSLRLGMYDWDKTGRVASRESLMYYNPKNHVWRASMSDLSGTDYNGITEHVMSAWACYFTDGAYKNYSNLGDNNLNFGLLSWNNNNYVAGCWLTIID